MLIVGHRGAMGHAPENTLASIQSALDLGVDMIEIDVVLSKDHDLMIFHDRKLDRTTNGSGYLSDQKSEQLRLLDAGNGEKISTLLEGIHLINRKVPLNIELKAKDVAAPVSALLKDLVHNQGWQYNDFLVSSFFHTELAEFHHHLPEIRVGALVIGELIDHARFAQDLGAYSVHVAMDFLTTEWVIDAHQRGLKLFVFTVDDRDDFQLVKSYGADGIFTNYPDRFVHNR